MWKTLFIIAIVTATLEWLFVFLCGGMIYLIQAILWSIWAAFCFIKLIKR